MPVFETVLSEIEHKTKESNINNQLPLRDTNGKVLSKIRIVKSKIFLQGRIIIGFNTDIILNIVIYTH